MNVSVESRPKSGAWRSPLAHLRFWPVAAIGVALDLVLKRWAFASLRPDDVRPFWKGVIEFRRSLNPGAVFGLGAGQAGFFIAASVLALGFVVFLFAGSHARQRSLHVALGLILAGALGNLYDRACIQADVVHWNTADGAVRVDVGVLRSDSESGEILLGRWPEGDSPLPIARDDVVESHRQGVVRDFIRIVPDFPNWVPVVGGKNVWPWVFNLADSMLVVGVGVLLIQFWFVRQPTCQTAASKPNHQANDVSTSSDLGSAASPPTRSAP